MGSFMTLVAVCEGCADKREVYADDLFEFDCACEACGGLLVIQEDALPDEEDESGFSEEDESGFSEEDESGFSEEDHDHDEASFLDEAPPAELRQTKEDTLGDDLSYDYNADRPTQADTEDPYELAAAALDPIGTGRFLRPSSAYGRVELDEDQNDTLLQGLSTEAPPLPNWDGGDTQLVDQLAHAEPAPSSRLSPLDLADENREESGVGEHLQGVEVVEVTGTSGRGSRTYEPEQLLRAEAIPTRPSPGPVPPIPDPTPVPKSGRQQPAVVSADARSGNSSLFGEDLDWLALIDDRLPEGDDEDQGGRVVITMSEESAPSEEQLKETIEKLDGGAALGSLILGSLSADRNAQRYEDEVSEDGETKRFDPGKTQPPPGEDAPGEDKARLPGQPTLAHGTLPGEDSEDDEGAQPTLSHQRLDTQSWAAAFAKEKAERREEGKEDDEDGPTRAWLGRPPQPKTQAIERTWEAGPPEDSTRNWPQAKPQPGQGDAPATRSWSEDAVTAGGPPAPRGSSSRHLHRQGDGVRAIEKFRRENLDPALVCAREVGSAESDHFRQLYQQIFCARNGSSPRTVLITSPRRGEGKTTIAANLAIAAARVPGRGAVLVDADPRGRGVLAAFGERSPMEGLLEALETGADPNKYVVQFPLGSMDVVPLGIRGSNASELIASDHMADFMRGLQTAYSDWAIIIDGSSVLKSGADPLTLAQLVDGVVLVVRAGQANEEEVTRVADMIGRKRLLGVVLNDAKV